VRKSGGANPQACIFADCYDLAIVMDKVALKHYSREANEVAHELARNSFSDQTFFNWVDGSLSFILQTLLNDVTILRSRSSILRTHSFPYQDT
jgi:hypothetical protein